MPKFGSVKDNFQFRKLTEKELRNIVLKHLNNANAKLNARIKLACPVDTGRLRHSWKMTPARFIRGYGYTASNGTNVHYAPYVRYGHRVMRNGKQVGFAKGQFFLRGVMKRSDKDLQEVAKNVTAEIFTRIRRK